MKKWICYKPNFEYEKLNPDIDSPWGGHKYFAYDLVRNFKPKIIVELGVMYGTSFFSMQQAVKDGNLKTRSYGIDCWEGDKHAGIYGQDVYTKVKKIKETYYKNLNIKLVKKYFDKAAKGFHGKKIDLLHIDGLHTYQAVKHDFKTWLPLMSKKGIIMLHDIVVKRDDFGVYKLWRELKKKFKTFEFHHSNGLGLVFLNPKTNTWRSILKEKRLYYELVWSRNLIRKLRDEADKKDSLILKQDQKLHKLRGELKSNEKEITNLSKIKEEFEGFKEGLIWKNLQKYRSLKQKLGNISKRK